MPQSYSPELKGIAYRQIQVEQNRCAMADRGCCAVFLYISSKSSRKHVLIVVLLSYDT